MYWTKKLTSCKKGISRAADIEKTLIMSINTAEILISMPQDAQMGATMDMRGFYYVAAGEKSTKTEKESNGKYKQTNSFKEVLSKKEKISLDAVYAIMMKNPEYEAQIIDALRLNDKDIFGNYVPDISDRLQESKKRQIYLRKEKYKNAKRLKQYLEKLWAEREFEKALILKNYFEHKEEMECLNKKRVAAEIYERQIRSTGTSKHSP